MKLDALRRRFHPGASPPPAPAPRSGPPADWKTADWRGAPARGPNETDMEPGFYYRLGVLEQCTSAHHWLRVIEHNRTKIPLSFDDKPSPFAKAFRTMDLSARHVRGEDGWGRHYDRIIVYLPSGVQLDDTILNDVAEALDRLPPP